MPKLILPSGRGFDAGLAAFAAGSAGFVVFAMPNSLFTSLVELSRLPDFVAAAQPPLGDTARFAAVVTALAFTFAAVWALMAVLGRGPVRREAAVQSVVHVPRQRRADAHPDAPPRPPLLARDLGEPLELEELADDPAEERPLAEAGLRPLPGFLVPQEQEQEREREREQEPATGTEAEFGFPQPGPEAVPVPEPEPELRTETDPRPIPELAARLPEAEVEEESDQSLSQLVNRIESGLSRKRQALPAVELPQAEETAVEQERVGHRLRSAINDLQKIASSGA